MFSYVVAKALEEYREESSEPRKKRAEATKEAGRKYRAALIEKAVRLGIKQVFTKLTPDVWSYVERNPEFVAPEIRAEFHRLEAENAR